MLLIDKPSGPTSHDVIDMVRRALRIRRVGHAGTLDPFATGLLVVLVGRATRLSRYLVGLPKRYTGVIRLGVTTDTLDRTGQVLDTNDRWNAVTDESVRAGMQAMVGKQRQRVPRFSAKKIDGVRSYHRARRNLETPDLEHDIEVLSFSCENRCGETVSFSTEVSSGTYVRALASDLGQALGCGAHVAELRRTHVGAFPVGEAIAPENVTVDTVRPPRHAMSHLASVQVTDEERIAVSHGRSIEREPEESEGPVALLVGPDLVAVAERAGRELVPKVVLSG